MGTSGTLSTLSFPLLVQKVHHMASLSPVCRTGTLCCLVVWFLVVSAPRPGPGGGLWAGVQRVVGDGAGGLDGRVDAFFLSASIDIAVSLGRPDPAMKGWGLFGEAKSVKPYNCQEGPRSC